MNFKKIFVLCFLFCFTISFAESKWNIILANWVDLSDYKDKSIASMLKSSIYNKLIKEKNFNVQSAGDDLAIFSISEADNICLSNKGDIIIYGYYYVEGKSLLVITEVWDALKKQLKMRSESRGVVSRDIFDTIDEISLNVKEKIKEVLPTLSLEEETEVKKLRQTIYEKQEIKIERQFYTKFGVGVDNGRKNMKNYYYDNNVLITKEYDDPYPVLYPMIGFMIRYWDIRVDFYGGPMPGWLTYNFVEKELKTESPVHYMLFGLTYYLPFLSKQLGLGINLRIANFPGRLETDENGNFLIEGADLFPQIPLSFNIFWNPNKNWEIYFSINPFMVQYKQYYSSSSVEYNFNKVNFEVPFISLSSAYFINSDIGFEIGVDVAEYYFYEGRFNNSQEEVSKECHAHLANFILNFIYRVDYSELNKK